MPHKFDFALEEEVEPASLPKRSRPRPTIKRDEIEEARKLGEGAGFVDRSGAAAAAAVEEAPARARTRKGGRPRGEASQSTTMSLYVSDLDHFKAICDEWECTLKEGFRRVMTEAGHLKDDRPTTPPKRRRS